MTTSDTRDLRKRIIDAQKQYASVERGDKAMLEEEYNEAVIGYEEALKIKATPEIEQKVRTARAHVLLREAKDAIGRGDLLTGEDKLNSSIWNHPLYEAQTRVEKMRPAFEAARQVRNGDHALSTEDYKEAIRIYQEVMPRLPSPADELVRKKIDEARRLDAAARGDRALKREDWDHAIEAYEESLKLGFDDKIQEKLITAKARLP
jgi:tetratricopeptide (TPR) repeat protein